MKKFTKTAFAAAALFVSSYASAGIMMIDLTSFGGNAHDAAKLYGIPDTDFKTQEFDEFTMGQLLATSVYDINQDTNQFLGTFFDTNLTSDFDFHNIPSSGTSMAGTGTISLKRPTSSQKKVDKLAPDISPNDELDDEGFGQTWNLFVNYRFNGVLTGSGPVYTGGFFEVYFDSRVNDIYDGIVLKGNLISSTLQAANLKLNFNLTEAAKGFLKIFNGSSYVDAHDTILAGGVPTLTFDGNVNPPIPTLNQLLKVKGDDDKFYAIRQTTLDSSVTADIPEPSSIAFLGLALLGLGAAARRKA